MTYMQAALTVLSYAERPLTVPEITSVAVAEGLIRPRGRTPDRTMASVLYRRMARDADAPVIGRGGRLWLRSRPLPDDEAGYLARRSRRTHTPARRPPGGTPHNATVRKAALLPPPPLRLPGGIVSADEAQPTRSVGRYAPLRRERAVARAGERAERLLRRLEARHLRARDEDHVRTDHGFVLPLLRHLGYRQGLHMQDVACHSRGAVARVLVANGAPAIALHTRRFAHDLDDEDAWRALATALEHDAPYAAVSNGREVRLYDGAVAEAGDDVAAALVLALDLALTPKESGAWSAQAAALWLLARASVAGGALDAYATDRAVGSALLDALDTPDAPLARSLVAAVRVRSGRELPASLVLRHARVAVRGRRGRDGEPLPEDVAMVAAVREESNETAAPVSRSA